MNSTNSENSTNSTYMNSDSTPCLSFPLESIKDGMGQDHVYVDCGRGVCRVVESASSFSM